VHAQLAEMQAKCASQLAAALGKFEAERALVQEKLTAELRNSQALTAALENEQIAHTSTKEALRKELDAAAVREAELQAKLSCEEEAHAACRSELELSQQLCRDLEKRLKAAESRVRELEPQPPRLKDQISALELELQRSGATLMKEREAATQKLADNEERHRQAMRDSQMVLLAAQQKVEEAESRADSAEHQLAAAKAALDKAVVRHCAELEIEVNRNREIKQELDAAVERSIACEQKATAAEQEVIHLHQAAKLLHDDLENALSSATELHESATFTDCDVQTKHGAWVGLYRRIGRTLRTKFPFGSKRDENESYANMYNVPPTRLNYSNVL